MPTSVRTTTEKKQLANKKQPALPKDFSLPDRAFESAILDLEDACIAVLDNPMSHGKQSSESLYWQQMFINIATPISLSLMESKGPRHFHYHYRHREEDASILHPILENPVDMLAQVCEDALSQCQTHLVGISDRSIAKHGQILERALRSFLTSYKNYKKSA